MVQQSNLWPPRNLQEKRAANPAAAAVPVSVADQAHIHEATTVSIPSGSFNFCCSAERKTRDIARAFAKQFSDQKAALSR